MSLSDLLGEIQQFEKTDSSGGLASGLNAAFQSNETAPFPQMIGQLFANSDGQQRAGILNHLLGAAGPSLAGGLLSEITGSGTATGISPQQAQQVQPDAVQRLAEHAQNADPSIVQRAAEFYSQHPQVVQSLGAGAVALIVSHMRSRATGA